MKTTKKIYGLAPALPVALAAGFVSACSWPAAAADMDYNADSYTGGIYFGADAGPAILQNIISQGSVTKFDVGLRVDLNLGYNINQNFAVELQTGLAFNSFSSVDGVPASNFSYNEYVWSVPVMLNGIYKHSFNDHWQVYGGLGAGVLISTLDQWDPLTTSTSSTDSTFGYQAMFGIKYVFGRHAEVGLGYNFLGSLDHHWDSTLAGPGITTSPTYLHSILLNFTYKF
ncbi:MAG TPA: outer membrane beta-barrel protein [Candidatus Acidoferrales bacterium]|nr:outer membrane beta-barrel protein [Candidatus Acidoferrales bacterium]